MQLQSAQVDIYQSQYIDNPGLWKMLTDFIGHHLNSWRAFAPVLGCSSLLGRVYIPIVVACVVRNSWFNLYCLY